MDTFDENDVSILIKTFLRPGCCRRLVNSIRRFYPFVPILIADDSHVPVAIDKEVRIFHLPFDSGISKGRNVLLGQLETPYFVLCDDDFIFTRNTKLEKLFQAIQRGADLAGGQVRGHGGWFGYFDERNRAVFRQARGIHNGFPVYDFVQNFFFASATKFFEHRLCWREQLKVREHQHFFRDAKGKLRITYLPEVICDHAKDCVEDGRIGMDKTELYERFRYRWKHEIH